ncbi:unnamed protein product, partial [Staurois parvus]
PPPPPERAFYYYRPPFTAPWKQESGSAYTIKQPAASLRSHLVPVLRVSLLPFLLSGDGSAPLKKSAAPLKNATLGNCLFALW